MRAGAVVVAAGRGSRFSGGTSGAPKVYEELAGRRVLLRALEGLLASSRLSFLVLVIRPEDEPLCRALTAQLPPSWTARLAAVVPGGATRADSVAAGLAALPPEAEAVIVHDGARPLVTPELVARVLDGLDAGGGELDGVVPVLPLDDTVKRVTAEGRVDETLARSALRRVQTPQAFTRAALEQAYRWRLQQPAGGDGGEAGRWTDDAALIEAAGGRIGTVPGDPANLKITRPEDLALAAALLEQRGSSPLSPGEPTVRPRGTEDGGTEGRKRMRLRVGEGFDAHRLVAGRPLVLGGVVIPFPLGLEGHSDGDALTHAVMDALLGGAVLGDLGSHFPGRAEEQGISSLRLLERVAAMLKREGWRVLSVDSTVIAQAPRLAPHCKAMAENLAAVLGLKSSEISVKATSTDGMGFAGRGEGIAAKAAVLLEKPSGES